VNTVPEPATIVGAAIGLVAVAGYRKLRGKKKENDASTS
jgi:hypothetical protein